MKLASGKYALCLASLWIGLTWASALHAAQVEDLGVAVRAVVFGNSQGCLAESPSGQAGMFYIPYFTTTGGALVGIHPASGEHVHVPLPSKGGYGTGGGGQLFTLDTASVNSCSRRARAWSFPARCSNRLTT